MRRPAERLPGASEAAGTGATQRSLIIGEQVVGYSLHRSTRRTIGISVDRRGLRVGAPLRASLADIESAVLRHGEWIARKLDEWQQPSAAPLSIVDGLSLPVAGSRLAIRLAVGTNRAVWTPPGVDEPTLTLCLRRPQDAPRLLERALRERARELFAERMARHGPSIGVDLPPLSLSSARTRWGSCSRRSGIRLNWRLIHFPLAVIDYVIVHELVHLIEMNHGPRFWSLLAFHCPDFRAQRARLKQLAADCPRW